MKNDSSFISLIILRLHNLVGYFWHDDLIRMSRKFDDMVYDWTFFNRSVSFRGFCVLFLARRSLLTGSNIIQYLSTYFKTLSGVTVIVNTIFSGWPYIFFNPKMSVILDKSINFWVISDETTSFGRLVWVSFSLAYPDFLIWLTISGVTISPLGDS